MIARSLALLLPIAALLLPGRGGSAEEPPFPSQFRVFGTVQSGGQNIEPEAQLVIALVNGITCGADTTFRFDGPGEPLEDHGKTVYRVDVAVDGTGHNERPGCGTPGAEIRFYFPAMSVIAADTATFGVGGVRKDLDLSSNTELEIRGLLPLLSRDSGN